MTKFVKGKSGNPKGRPSKKKQAEKLGEEIKAVLGEDFKAKEGKDTLEKLLVFYNALFDKATSVGDKLDLARILGELSKGVLGYQKPRISSIESDDKKVTEISVTWREPEVADSDHPMKKLAQEKE